MAVETRYSFIQSNKIGTIKKDREYRIVFPRIFRESIWFEYFGTIQAELNSLSSSDPSIKCIHFDFKRCRWADPLPLMSILLEIIHFSHPNSAAHQDILVSIASPTGPPVQAPVAGPYQSQPDRLFRYLKNEGFLSCLKELAENEYRVRVIGVPQNDFECERITASYENSLFIPFQWMDLKPLSFDEWHISQIIEEINNKINNLITAGTIHLASVIDPLHHENLYYSIRQALQELIQNTLQHAYGKENESFPVAFYVRYRYGGLNKHIIANEDSITNFEKCLTEENNCCPRLEDSILPTAHGCLELFVLDRGIGITESYRRAKKNTVDQAHSQESSQFSAYDRAYIMAFSQGERANAGSGSQRGGLSLLHSLLMQGESHFLRIVEKDIWCGFQPPISRDTAKTRVFFSRDPEINASKAKQSSVQGFGYSLRLFTGERTDKIPDESLATVQNISWMGLSEENNKDSFLRELEFSHRNQKKDFYIFEQQLVIDDRFNKESYNSNYFINKLLFIYPDANIQANAVLWRVGKNYMKNDIPKLVEAVAVHCTTPVTLVLSDIEGYEAQTYVSALEQYRVGLDKDWVSNIKAIYFTTKNLQFAAILYEKDDSRHGFSTLDTQKNRAPLFKLESSTEKESATAREAITRWLMWHDSKAFWDKAIHLENVYISEQIQWGERTISGYLDFGQALRDEQCSLTAQAPFIRAWAIFEEYGYRITALDSLTKRILRDINIYKKNKQRKKYKLTQASPRLGVGSVYLTGSTQQNTFGIDTTLNFFVHPDTANSPKMHALLHWLPIPVPATSPAQSYERIGKTPYIAPLGWKSYEIPRFDRTGKNTCCCPPAETYKYWQGNWPNIIKQGHWVYEGHHDYITINIPLAVNAAFLEGGRLVRFLMHRILPYLGIRLEHISQAWRSLATEKDELCNKCAICDSKTLPGFSSTPIPEGILLYRSHPSSEHILQKLLTTLTTEGRKKALASIYALSPVRDRWNASAFLTPSGVRAQIAERIGKNPDLPVVLFDDAAITGRTLADMGSMAMSLGAHDLHKIVIVNRKRHPVDDNADGSFAYFWRLDAPPMGHEGNCPFCTALSRIETFKNHYIYPESLDRWIAEWSSVSPAEDWPSGLSPSPLPTIEPKGYSYRIDNSHLQNGQADSHLALIHISHSIGRVIYTTELHTMTGRDDYFLKKIKQESDQQLRIELIAAQLLLFGSELSTPLVCELSSILLNTIISMNDDNIHTSLASLVLISTLSKININIVREKIIKPSLLKELSSYFNVQKYDENISSSERYKEYISIICSYFVFSNYINDEYESAFLLGKSGLRIEGFSQEQSLNDLFTCLYSRYGRKHSSPLQYIKKHHYQQAKQYIPQALKDLNRVNGIIEILVDHKTGMFDLILSKDNHTEFRLNSIKTKNCLESIHDASLPQNDTPDATLFAEAKESIEQLDLSVRKLFSGAFGIINKDIIDKWRHDHCNKLPDFCIRLDELLIAHGVDQKKYAYSDFVVDVNARGREIWIPYSHSIQETIRESMNNIRYANLDISDPFASSYNDGNRFFKIRPATAEYANAQHSLWVQCRFQEKNFSLAFASSPTFECKNASDLMNLLRRNWGRYRELDYLGGSVETFDIANRDDDSKSVDAICLQFTIPYVGYLGIRR